MFDVTRHINGSKNQLDPKAYKILNILWFNFIISGSNFYFPLFHKNNSSSLVY